MVGLAGFEPATPCPPDKCATKLRYSPLVFLAPLKSLDAYVRLRFSRTRMDTSIGVPSKP